MRDIDVAWVVADVDVAMASTHDWFHGYSSKTTPSPAHMECEPLANMSLAPNGYGNWRYVGQQVDNEIVIRHTHNADYDCDTNARKVLVGPTQAPDLRDQGVTDLQSKKASETCLKLNQNWWGSLASTHQHSELYTSTLKELPANMIGITLPTQLDLLAST